MLKRVAAFSYALVIVCLSWNSVSAADRPNILWVSVEDISAHLGCYGDTNATTPNLDAVAAQSVRYTNAFTCHGVCAPSRTGIITAMWPDGLGANHMRSKATLPPHIQCFPHYLKESGYYCTNNSKTDYNFHWTEEDVWNESSGKAHWKNRPDPNQPFFAVFNLTMTHESRIWPQNWKNVVKNVPPEKLHRPDDMKVAQRRCFDCDAFRLALNRLETVLCLIECVTGSGLKFQDGFR